MAGQLARRGERITGLVQRDRADQRLDLFQRNSAGAQEGGRASQSKDRGFDSNRARPAVKDRADAARKPLRHMLGPGRRDLARGVG